MLEQILNQTREKAPLIHNITNYVSANDCANITLACGASPIMAEEYDEVEEITAGAAALVINTGILTQAKLIAILAAGKYANDLKHPVVLDPVGVGASRFRTNAIHRILEEIKIQVIRGNGSEIKKIYDIYSMGSKELSAMTVNHSRRGVDASAADVVTDNNLDHNIRIAKELSHITDAIVVMTGEIDIITDAQRVILIHNGNSMLRLISGSGCMLSSLIGAYCGANSQSCFEACVAAVGVMGLCGEYAYEKILHRQEGNASFRSYLIDYVSRLDGDLLMRGLKQEKR